MCLLVLFSQRRLSVAVFAEGGDLPFSINALKVKSYVGSLPCHRKASDNRRNKFRHLTQPPRPPLPTDVKYSESAIVN